ncbi:hypothetical protein ACGFNU_36135 [Spirillospora sp. NPDC048911]|uniref:hypothetical protein n=1 Tax=Spirillospora sp. NPDC048911 TaxID=3364527 RepID=UPI00371D9CFE
MIRRFASLGVAGMAMAGMLGTAITPAFADPPRRVSISGSVYIEDDENWPSQNEYCHDGLSYNDIVYGYQQVIFDKGWGCGGEVHTTLYAMADLLPDGGIRIHGTVYLREGTCGCLSDRIRMTKDFNQVIAPETNAEVDPGFVEWDGGDKTHVHFRVYNRAP